MTDANTPRVRQRMRELLTSRRLSAAIVIAAVVNVVLAVAYVWSYGGQTTTVRVEVRGGNIAAFVDGNLRAEGQFPISQPSSVTLGPTNPRTDMPSLPTDGTIGGVRVESLESDEALFDSSEQSSLAPESEGWSDYAVEVKFQNALEASIVIEDRSQRTVSFVLWRSGYNSARLAASDPPGPGESQLVGGPADVSAVESVRGTVAIFLRGYPLAVLLALAVVAVTFGAAALCGWDDNLQRVRLSTRAGPIAVGILALVFVATTLVLTLHYTQALPHVADEGGYLFQSRIFASGRTHLSTPPVPEAFQFSYTGFIVDFDGRWASFYTPGQALTLVPGTLIGAPWLVPALVGAVNLVLLFAIGHRAYNGRTGVLAAALFAVSPFVLMQSATFLSHTTTTAYMLGSVLAVVSLRERPWVSGAIGGLCIGAMFLTRPLPAVVIVLPMAGLLLSGLIPAEDRAREAKRIAAFAAAGFVMLVVYFLFNWSMTGDAFQNGYQAEGDLENTLGFGGAHSVAAGIDNQVFNLAALALVLNGWPALVGLAFVLMPFVLGTRDRMDWFCAVCALMLISSAAFYYTTGTVRGPRYIYEAVPFLLLLTARGIDLLATFGPRMRRASGTPAAPDASISGIAVYGFAVVLLMLSASGWLIGLTPTWRIPGAPAQASGLEDPRSDDRLISAANAMDLDNALIVVRPCGQIRECYLAPFLENDLSLDGEVVWVYDLGEAGNAPVFAEYPCRDLYYATYPSATIARDGSTPPSPGGTCP